MTAMQNRYKQHTQQAEIANKRKTALCSKRHRKIARNGSKIVCMFVSTSIMYSTIKTMLKKHRLYLVAFWQVNSLCPNCARVIYHSIFFLQTTGNRKTGLNSNFHKTKFVCFYQNNTFNSMFVSHVKLWVKCFEKMHLVQGRLRRRYCIIKLCKLNWNL